MEGYGETMLLNKCSNGVPCSEEAHQLNRRTEFKVTKIRE
jgi:peptidoglycan-associated lipoprotein